MNRTELTPADCAVIEAAKRTASALHMEGSHEVASALRTQDGEIYSGINIKARARFADVCGEVAALSAMVGAGRRDPEVIVAISTDGAGGYDLMPPCGRCRELISDFDPSAWVIVGTLEQPYKVRVSDLLPLKAW